MKHQILLNVEELEEWNVSRAFRRQIVTKRAFQKRSKLFGPCLGALSSQRQ